MNPPRVQPEDYINFLIGTAKAASAVEVARVQPAKPRRRPRRLHSPGA